MRPQDLTLRGVCERLLHALTAIDGRLIRTVWRLVRFPGALTVAYVEGARKPYVSPFQLFLLANILFFTVQSATNTNIFGSPLESHLHHQDWSEFAQSLVQRRLEAMHLTLAQYRTGFDRAVTLNAKSLVFLMIVPYALLLPLLLFRTHERFMTHVVFALHVYSFLLFLFSLSVAAVSVNVLLGGASLNSHKVDTVLSVMHFSLCAAYIHCAIGPVYRVRGPARAAIALILATTVGAIVLGYRFVLFLITLYGAPGI